MLVYSDVISGDEMVSDAFKIQEVDDIVYEVNCRMVTLNTDVAVDIGANPSQEEPGEEPLEEGAKTVNDIVHSFRLQPTAFDKKNYLVHLKAYMKTVKAYLQKENPERVDAFEKGATAYAKKIVANFKNFEFYTGEGMNPDGMVALLNYRDDGITPYLTFWKDGMKEIKL